MSERTRRGTVMPCLTYRDAEAAMKWLTRAFGFEEKMVVPGDAKRPIAHAEMTLGDGMIMLGSAYDDGFGKHLRSPAALGAVTASIYALVPDVAAHHARAIEAGAEIVLPLTTKEYGTDYTARDPEGHIWSFGDYDPFA